MKYVLFVALVAALFVSACTTTTTDTELSDTMNKAEVAQQTMSAPEYEVQTIDGKTISSNDEKPTIIYFMASWCPSCAKNWDVLSEIAHEYEEQVTIFAISIDPTDTNDVLSKLAQEKEFEFFTVAGNPQFANSFNVRQQTTVVGISSENTIVFEEAGVFTEAEWREMIESVGEGIEPSTKDMMAEKEMMDDSTKINTAEVEEFSFATAPSFEVTTTDGQVINSDNNKPTLIYFMASWCPSCAKNWNSLSNVIPDYEGEVDFFAISVDPTDDDRVLTQLAERKGFKFSTVAGDPDFASEFNVRKQTAVVGISSDNQIVLEDAGVFSEAEWREMIESLQ